MQQCAAAARAADQWPVARTGPFDIRTAILPLLAVGRTFGLARPTADAFEHVLADHVAGGQLDRVVAIEAGATEPCLRLLGGRDQARQRNVAQRIGSDGPPD